MFRIGQILTPTKLLKENSSLKLLCASAPHFVTDWKTSRPYGCKNILMKRWSGAAHIKRICRLIPDKTWSWRRARSHMAKQLFVTYLHEVSERKKRGEGGAFSNRGSEARNIYLDVLSYGGCLYYTSLNPAINKSRILMQSPGIK